jgi:hypothetical protein
MACYIREVPVGTTEAFNRPYGTSMPQAPRKPGEESRGYFRASLRDNTGGPGMKRFAIFGRAGRGVNVDATRRRRYFRETTWAPSTMLSPG